MERGSGTKSESVPTTEAKSAGVEDADERARRLVLEREHGMDLQRAGIGALIGGLTWPVFALFDVLQAIFVGTGHLVELLALRTPPTLLLVGLAFWARSKPGPSPRQLEIALVLTIATLSFCLSWMCIYTGGFDSIYAAGVLLTSAGILFVPRPFAKSATWMLVGLVPYPLVLFGSTFFVPEMRAELHDVPSMTHAVQFHFVGLVIGLFIAANSHVFWSMRRELYESRSIGRYRLKQKLGKGGMGEVYAAYHHGLRRDVAVKILKPTSEHEAIAQKRFEREVRATTELTHPNTVRIYDYGTAEDGRLYYAMELLEGVDLARLVAREGKQPVARAVHFVRQAAHALAEAHARGIVHRDVKPENLFVTTLGGEADFVKVLDFGIASVVDEAQHSLTRTGAIAGTPGTMSPEVIVGNPATPAADVYALGAVLYLLLAGRLPFGDEHGPATLVAHVNEVAIPPSERRGEPIPADVEALVMRCLAKDPSERYPNARALARALDGCTVAGTWIPARDPRSPPSVPPPPAEPAKEPEGTDLAVTRLVRRPSDRPGPE